jgi:hypothetical protein
MFDQPGNEAAKLRFIDPVPLVEGNQKWRENTVQSVRFTRIHV